MKFTVRELVYIAIFGAIWGALEITLGSYLHVIFPPLADTFVVGLVMASVGMVVALIGRLFVPRTGSVLMIGIVTAILKMISIGGVKVGPLAAILIESLLAELALFVARTPRRWSFIFAGAGHVLELLSQVHLYVAALRQGGLRSPLEDDRGGGEAAAYRSALRPGHHCGAPARARRRRRPGRMAGLGPGEGSACSPAKIVARPLG